MTRIDARPSFRLLDALVGWDRVEDEDARSLVGFDDVAGLRLARLRPELVSPEFVWSRISPPRLVASCWRCHWFLLAPAPDARILHRGPCNVDPAKFEALAGWAGELRAFVDPVALAEGPHGLAVADPGAGRVWMLPRGRGRSPVELCVAGARALAFDSLGVLHVVTDEAGEAVRRFDPSGVELEPCSRPPVGRAIVALHVAEGGLWAVVELPAGESAVWRLELDDPASGWAAASEDELAALPKNGVVAVSASGFCIEELGPDRAPLVVCHDWSGRPLARDEDRAEPGPVFEQSGTLTTVAIDSGIDRCRWHRVRVDADLPFGTSIEIEVASADNTEKPPHEDDDWIDWTRPQRPAGTTDFLIDQPPGRYLFLRLTLHGDGRRTPVVRRIRLDFPRATSFDRLPEVYRETHEAEDFGERFLALFDAELEGFDRAIERLPSLFDFESTPSELLPWLASFLGLSLEPSWDEARRRELIAAAPDLYRRRGTVEGLRKIIRVLTGLEPVITEFGLERPWVALGGRDKRSGAALGDLRLFGRNRVRVRLGSSRLGNAAIHSHGNPDEDAIASGAWRLRVFVPPLTAGDRDIGGARARLRERIEQIVEHHKPAHTVVDVRVGGAGFVLGGGLTLGVGSTLTPLPAPILGENGNVRLRRSTVLWSRRGPI